MVVTANNALNHRLLRLKTGRIFISSTLIGLSKTAALGLFQPSPADRLCPAAASRQRQFPARSSHSQIHARSRRLAAAAFAEDLLEEIAKYGVANVKRIYGNGIDLQSGGWKKVLLDHSIQPIQQFAYTKGKNTIDSALTFDAIDLLLQSFGSNIFRKNLL